MKIGIIGCGMIAEKRHVPEYQANAQVQLCAWYDVATERAQQMADRYGGEVYADWKALIDEGGLDAVSVCSPNATHAEISIYALDHGLHVLCEKPMATSLDECRQMVMAEKRSGKLLFIGQNQRLNKAHIKARKLIEQGRIGKVLGFRTSFGHQGPEIWTNTPKTWFYNKSMAAFGAVFDLGIHKLDLMDFLLDDPFVSVGAMLGTLDKTFEDGSPVSVDDNAVVILRTRSGALGQMHASWTNYGSEDNSTRIFGSKGVLKIFESPDAALVLETPDECTSFKDVGDLQTNEKQFSTGVIDAFVSDVLEKRPAMVSGECVYRAMQAVFAAIESHQTGKIVDIDDHGI